MRRSSTDGPQADRTPGTRAGASRGEPPEVSTWRPNYLLRLLEAKSPSEYGRILPLLTTTTLARGAVIAEPGVRIPFVYFPQGCVTSLIKVLLNGKQIEVGTAGIEGMAGMPVFHGAESMPLLGLIQVSGDAQCMTAEELRKVAVPGTALHSILQCYAQFQFDQAAQSVACNWMHRIEHRCARWLLMTHDRVQRDEFDLTHEYLATMLGARRAGVTQVADSLREAGLIRYQRGRIAIVDRPGLERAACECYESDRADYQRLLSLES